MVAAPNEQSPLQMTEAEYLAFEAGSETKHEFVNGNVFAMTGASFTHAVICQNCATTLATQLTDKPCTVVTNDVRVRVASKVSYRYPDVMVICGEAEFYENHKDTLINPIVILEVLSPSTALVDRNEKLDEHMQIASLQEYVLVSQDNAKVERYLRQASGDWLYSKVIGLDGALDLPSLGCELALKTVYKKVALGKVQE